MSHAHLEQSHDMRMHDIRAPVQRIEHHDHSSKTLATIALILASCTLGGLIVYLIISQVTAIHVATLERQLADAKIQAGAAKAEATASEARTNARVALDKVEDFRAKLAAKGIDVPPLDGH